MARPKDLQFYNIRFVNEAGLDGDERMNFYRELMKIFMLVGHEYLTLFKDRAILAISPVSYDGPLQDFELRCFLLASRNDSRANRLGSPGLGPAGTTWRSTRGTVSEVYVDDTSDALGLARLVFHEFMHNKLEMGNEMHTDYDVGFGLAREQVSSQKSMYNRSTDELTQKNAIVMARALLKSVPQYTGP
jgi:hypothetical protein